MVQLPPDCAEQPIRIVTVVAAETALETVQVSAGAAIVQVQVAP